MLWLAKNKYDHKDVYRVFGHKPVRFVDKPVKIFGITIIKAEETNRWVDKGYENARNVSEYLYNGIRVHKSCVPVYPEWEDEPIPVKLVLREDDND